MKRIDILLSTKLVANMPEEIALGNGYYGSDVQLRVASDGYWMTSPITGNHFVPCSGVSELPRVRAHWEGFKLNQPAK